MSLEDYFVQMPHTGRKIKTRPISEKQATAEPEEANASEGEAATAETEETVSDVNPSILSALSKITDNITKLLDAKVDKVLAAINEQTSQMQALTTRVGDAETRISGVEDTLDALQAKVTKLEKQTSDMAEHIDDLENRSRRCNLRLIGLPEGMEGKDPVTFLEKWIPSYLNLKTKAGKIKLDRAHRSSAPRPDPNQRARPIIMKLHNFADKQRVMAAARRFAAEPNQPADRIKVSFFNDYSAAVAKKRKAFDEVKICMRTKKVDYALLYPGDLKVIVNGRERRFNTPEAAATYVESLP